MIEAGRPRAGTRLITKRDRFAYRARVGVSRVFRFAPTALLIDAETSAFSSEMIELALVDDFERFLS